MMRRLLFLVFGLLFGFCAGAGSKPPAPPSQLLDLADASASRAGEMIFQTRCFVCHGREGKGDGPASTGLGAAVRDLTRPAWPDSTSDETIGKVIRSGAAAVGGPAAMAPSTD